MRAESALMYIKSILLLSPLYSDIPGGVVVSTTDYKAIDCRFETHLGHDFFFSCYIFSFAISFQFISFPFISFHIISFHFISFHFISFHFISFHNILAPSLLRPPDFWPRPLLLAPPDFQTLRHACSIANFASMKNLLSILARTQSIGREKSEKIGKIKQKNSAAIMSWFFYKTQNPRLINESGLWCRAYGSLIIRI